MNIEIKLCKKEDKNIISGLCQFYYYDLETNSELANLKYTNGYYEKMAYFDNYWLEDNRFPYLIYDNDNPIGFALIHDITVNPSADWKIAEFFIMAPYRHKGIGKLVADWLFEKYSGHWEISVLKDNVPALKFWKKVLNESTLLTHNEFQNYLFFEVLK